MACIQQCIAQSRHSMLQLCIRLILQQGKVCDCMWLSVNQSRVHQFCVLGSHLSGAADHVDQFDQVSEGLAVGLAGGGPCTISQRGMGGD